jgi:cysteine desulfurase
VPAIVGLGTACLLAADWINGGGPERMAKQHRVFEQGLIAAIPSACINGASAERTWSISNIGFPNVEAELLLLALSERGVDVSAGSACSSGALKTSSVLNAMGPQPGHKRGVQYGSVRFSWCHHTTMPLLTRATAITADVIARLGALHPGDGVTATTPTA